MNRKVLLLAIAAIVLGFPKVNAEELTNIPPTGSSGVVTASGGSETIIADSKNISTEVQAAPDANKVLSDSVNKTTSKSDKKLKAEKELPAINLDNGSDKNKNIVPVFDLQGGVIKSEAKPVTPYRAWIDGNYATGNWGGLRTRLEENGVKIYSNYSGFNMTKVGGGIPDSQNKTRYQGVSITGVYIDSNKLLHIKHGGSFVASFANQAGYGITNGLVGDTQYVNSYDVARSNILYEFYYSQNLFNDKLTLKAGKQDQTNDFSTLDAAYDFINTGMVYPVYNLSVYNNTAFGVTGILKPTNWLTLKSAWSDGSPKVGGFGIKTLFDGNGGYRINNEVDLTHSFNGYNGKFILGHWINTTDTKAVVDVDNGTDDANSRYYRNNYGMYTGLEQVVFKENKTDDQGLSLFTLMGMAPGRTNYMSNTYNVGAVYKGLIPKRDKDMTGLGYNFAKMSGDLNRNSNEAVIEAYYKFQLTPWMSVQPDIQFVHRPSGMYDSSWVFGARTSFNL